MKEFLEDLARVAAEMRAQEDPLLTALGDVLVREAEAVEAALELMLEMDTVVFHSAFPQIRKLMNAWDEGKE